MTKILKFSAIFLFEFFIYVTVSTERTRDKMYTPIAGASCFRRLNGTHQTGCSSSMSGSVGVIHVIKTPEDFNFILNNPPSPPYAPVIPPYLFTRDNIIKLKNDAIGNVSVIIIINKIEQMKNFSQELPCPNQYSNIVLNDNDDNNKCDPKKPETLWNPVGTGLLHEDFPFPIYYVADLDEIKKILDCFEKYNNYDYENHNRRSLCSIQVNAFMSAAVSSEVCIRRTNFVNNLKPIKYCDPLEGKNIYATLYPRDIIQQQKSSQRYINKNEKFILITCRLDTTSMFDGVGLGAMDSLISYATLINVAHVLSNILNNNNDKDKEKINVLYVIFNGESYDYIGSQRFVYDLNKNIFPSKNTYTNPINFDNILFMIDIGILDDLNNIKLFYLNDNKNFVNELYTRLNNANNLLKLNIKFTKNDEKNKRIPPTSAQSFLRENSTFPVCIINSAAPLNLFYHSAFDDAINIGYHYRNISNKIDFSKLQNRTDEAYNFESSAIQMKIRDISTVIAYSVYGMLKDDTYNGSLVANPVLVDELLYCFLLSSDCPLFKAASYPNSLPGLPAPPIRYISVHGASQEAAGWTYRLLGYITSQIYPNIKKDNCTILPLHWFAGYNNTGECRLTTHNYSYALSPAFLEPDYDWKSGKYSTWTESTWSPFSARIFLRPSFMHEAWTLAAGIVVMLLSFVLIYLINSRSDVLFENCLTTDTISEPAAC